jgi:centromere/kinetochore protein ZW10
VGTCKKLSVTQNGYELITLFRYLYNDALWLAEQLRDFGKNWVLREDLSQRASGKVRLDNEVEMLQKFGKRAYSNEMSTQRTILTDLLGGEFSVLLRSCSY